MKKIVLKFKYLVLGGRVASYKLWTDGRMKNFEEFNKTEIKAIPFRCPSCNGWGTVGYAKKKCRSCNGTGLVVVDQETGEIKYGQSRLDKNP